MFFLLIFKPPLYYAVCKKNPEIVQLLVSNLEIDVNQPFVFMVIFL